MFDIERFIIFIVNKIVMNTEKVIEFKGTSYKITFPNNRQYVKIQNLKSILSSTYDSLEMNGPESMFAQAIIDTEAHLSVMCPDLVNSLNKTFGELSLIETKEIVEMYTSQVRPWYNELLNFVFGVNKEVEKIEEK